LNRKPVQGGFFMLILMEVSMVKFVFFAVSRYSGFVSHLSAFLAGLSLLLYLPLGVILLAFAIVFGSLSAFLRARSLPPSPPGSPTLSDVSDMMSDMFSHLSNHP
jgi:hypothetical protein